MGLLWSLDSWWSRYFLLENAFKWDRGQPGQPAEYNVSWRWPHKAALVMLLPVLFWLSISKGITGYLKESRSHTSLGDETIEPPLLS